MRTFFLGLIISMASLSSQAKLSNAEQAYNKSKNTDSVQSVASWACVDTAMDTIRVVPDPAQCNGSHAYQISQSSTSTPALEIEDDADAAGGEQNASF